MKTMDYDRFEELFRKTVKRLCNEPLSVFVFIVGEVMFKVVTRNHLTLRLFIQNSMRLEKILVLTGSYSHVDRTVDENLLDELVKTAKSRIESLEKCHLWLTGMGFKSSERYIHYTLSNYPNEFMIEHYINFKTYDNRLCANYKKRLDVLGTIGIPWNEDMIRQVKKLLTGILKEKDSSEMFTMFSEKLRNELVDFTN